MRDKALSVDLSIDGAGYPIILAAPEVPVERVFTPSARPAVVDHHEWARRTDAVRDAAREFEPLTEQDLRERFRGLTSKPLTDQDLGQLRVDVREAVLDDLADVLDHRVRGKLRGRRVVRVQAPRGYVIKTLRSLDEGEAERLESRLRARGWNDAQVKKGLRDRLGHLDKSSNDR